MKNYYKYKIVNVNALMITGDEYNNRSSIRFEIYF